jgi:hypothetical protein
MSHCGRLYCHFIYGESPAHAAEPAPRLRPPSRGQRARSLPLALVSSSGQCPHRQRRQEQKPVRLSGSLISQKRSIAIEDKRRHHGEYRTPKQGLYSVSTTTNQGRDPPDFSEGIANPPLVRRAEAGLPSVCSRGQILSRIPRRKRASLSQLHCVLSAPYTAGFHHMALFRTRGDVEREPRMHRVRHDRAAAIRDASIACVVLVILSTELPARIARSSGLSGNLNPPYANVAFGE